ncbi:UDP-3-O-(3-hydroxymyristoyl)glucosamine N-acyltransferase [Psychrobium sp. 1_MG-2023]|uniref:UDP-3-O-(3-hydroxymyristoyl)glucosamine N-acyltransferase n=1 Tax=Psychrobium sp. 1_MG-2023 TaxID=3062624 RepID=UPI000C332E71|nr:UDP-3-O-(3-hydroxymyristoyl)glucosamine N-acyltransferase [Psychrobium sp. 1_MG-2023]MDP2559986.1 UDP-3-O-(3-hydroxymyristoyl)glucosamine N-acyltransferase [Psychrobium sp. 1_MG-2023]PKF56351.1 UDP-3-O-(3-hydroxymyristoyl)glucosamine N-acyltransferase [Alteromonadales bacterium alter-6D02]
MKRYTLAELATVVQAKVIGDDKILISSIATLKSAQPGQISFLSNPKYRHQLTESNASAIIVREQDLDDYTGVALVVSDPYVAYAMLAQFMDPTPLPAIDIHSSVVIDKSAKIGTNVSIAANTVIESGVVIGDNCSIGANCFIGKNTTIGAGSKLWSNVAIYHEVTIGEACLFHAGAVIGSDGFGFAPHNGQWFKIPQTGGVTIGANCEIGAGTTVDRGALDDTMIGQGCIIDNQVHIGHNVILGQYCAVAGNTVFAGSSSIGDNCIIGGSCAISGHLTLCDGVTITGMSMVIKNIETPGVYSSGMPSQTNREWRKNGARYRQLDDIAKRLKQLEKKCNNS